MYQFFIALTFIVFNAFREIYRAEEIRTDNFLAAALSDTSAEILSNGNSTACSITHFGLRTNCSFRLRLSRSRPTELRNVKILISRFSGVTQDVAQKSVTYQRLTCYCRYRDASLLI